MLELELPDAAERAEEFAAEVVARVRLPLDYVRLNISATRAMLAR